MWACQILLAYFLPLSTQVVNFGLSHQSTTSNLERRLKDVKQQHSGQRFSMEELSVDDVMQIDCHAPDPEELGSALRPKTPYLESIWKRVSRHKRCHKTEHKVRRDRGCKKDPSEVASTRKKRGAPKPEAEVVRDREQAVRSVMCISAEQRMAMTSRSFHGTAVPADSGKCVTSETEAARAKFLKQWQPGNDNQPGDGNGSDLAGASRKRPQDSHEWGPAKKRNVPPPLTLFYAGGSELCDRVLARRKWICTSQAERFTDRFLDHGHHAYIVKKLHDRTLSTDPIALLCRFFGGCLLTEAWVQKAFGKGDAELECIHYQGIMHQPKTVMFSTACKENASFASVVKHVAKVAEEEKFRLTVTESLSEMTRHYDEWKDEKGEKSRPWVALCIAVAHEADHERMVKCIGSKRRRLVQTLDSMLNVWSKVDNDWVCPKSW